MSISFTVFHLFPCVRACVRACVRVCARMCALQTCMRLTRNREVLKRDDPAVMQKLREKFVAQARTYFGVPYHKRYQEKGSK